MVWNKDDLARAFICPKCHQHGGFAEEVRLDRPLAWFAGRYLAVSCSLCGFTEFYRMAVVQKAAETEQQATRLAEKVD